MASSRKGWGGSHIRSLPVVAREVYHRDGTLKRVKSPDEMIRELKRRNQKRGVMDDFREHLAYEKPSDRRRRERREAAFRIRQRNKHS
jgi:ribosomal protein S21